MPAIGFGSGVHGVVRADDEHNIDVFEIIVDFVHLVNRLVRHLRLGQKHVHVAGHAARDRMDAELHVDALGAQLARELGNRELRLGDRHAVTRRDDDRARILQQARDLACRDLGMLSVVFRLA